MRAVVDANVLLSALLGGRGTRPVLDALRTRRFQLFTSEPLLEELVSVLSRPQWQRLVTRTQARELLVILREAATMVHPAEHVTACRDPDDNAVLECALTGRAHCLVTGDKDLLALHPFRGIRILRPADFLRLLP